MLDEVQTGNGRTGKWFCFQHENFQPDVLVTAKGLGNGIPIGVCMATKKVADLFIPGSHGSTFGGNPLACRVALTTIEVIENNDLIDNADKLGKYIANSLQEKLSSNALVRNVRGKGLMIGIEMGTSCAELVDYCLEQKLLINVTAECVVRLLPPLIVDQSHADMIIEKLVKCIEAFTKAQA